MRFLRALYYSCFVHYKTTLCGLAAGALNALAHGVAPKQVAVSLALAALGAVAHDGDKQATQAAGSKK